MTGLFPNLFLNGGDSFLFNYFPAFDEPGEAPGMIQVGYSTL